MHLLLATAILRSLTAVLALDDKAFAENRAFETEATVESQMGTEARVVLCDNAHRAIADFPTPPPLGARLMVFGNTLVDRWGTKLLRIRRYDILSPGVVPAPIAVSLPDLARKDLNLRRVTVSGIVEDVFDDETDANWTFVILRNGASRTHLTLLKRRFGTAKDLRFSEISADGVCVRDHLGHRIHFTPHICLADGNDIRIVRPRAEDPFDVPPLSELYASGQEEIARSGRRRHTGVVKAAWDGSTFLLTTPDAPPCTAYIENDGDLPRIGDTVTAVGFPETDLFTVNLTSVRWRKENVPAQDVHEEPVDVSTYEMAYDERGEETFRSEWNGRRCRLRGTVRRMLANGTLLLESGGITLPFRASGDAADPFAGTVPGSVVEITGVCTLRAQHWSPRAPFPHVKGYQFIVQRPGDVRLISGPPWWTTARVLILIGTLVAALAGIFIWNRTLDNLATRRGRQLLKEQIARERALLKVSERSRLAIELHDSLSQNLSAIACQVTATKSALGFSREEARECLGAAERMLLSCRAELRRCLWDLRSDALDEPNMDAALRKILGAVAGTAKVHMRLHVSRRHLDDTTAHAVFCIIRELVSNAVRHGHADNIRIAGDLTNGKLAFSVRDDGCGFDAAARPGAETGHFGLAGIRDRAERLGASFAIESSPQSGTRAEISMTVAT